MVFAFGILSANLAEQKCRPTNYCLAMALYVPDCRCITGYKFRGRLWVLSRIQVEMSSDLGPTLG